MLTRRNFARLAAGALSAGCLSAKPNSVFRGVRIGVITYSFRELPGGAEETLGYCLKCGISGVELMAAVAESYAGAPELPRGRATTPQERDARRKAADALSAWRLSTSMGKFKELRRMYEDAGVKIYAFKLPPTLEMLDAEYDYIWNVAETLGADHITMELPTNAQLLQRVAEYAAKRKLFIAFHTHGQGGTSNFDQALAASPYTALNFDVGHHFGVNGESPVPVIERYHKRIASLHLKDRKGPDPATKRGGANMPLGEGETPLKEVLQLMRRNKYKFPASIEYEYRTPEGSDVLTEVRKCVEFCRRALA